MCSRNSLEGSKPYLAFISGSFSAMSWAEMPSSQCFVLIVHVRSWSPAKNFVSRTVMANFGGCCTTVPLAT